MKKPKVLLSETPINEAASQYINNPFTVNGITYAKIPSRYTKGKIADPKTGKRMTDADSVYVRQGDDGKWYQTRMDKDANNINYYLDNKSLIDRSNEIIDNQWEQGDGHKIAVNLADARARQQWFSNEDATKFLLTTAGLGALGGGLISAPLATTLGLAGGYAGGKAVDKGMQLATGKPWGKWMSNKTGLPEWFTEFTNPGAIVGGGIGGMSGVPLERSLRSYIPNINYIRLANALNNNVRNANVNLSYIRPDFNRFRLGDVEINNPSLYYRQGSTRMGDDFLNTGVVRAGDGYANPMFAKGKLWYGVPTKEMLTQGRQVKVGRFNLTKANEASPKTDLLVSTGEMVPSDQHAMPRQFVFTKERLHPYSEVDIKNAQTNSMRDFMLDFNNKYYNGEFDVLSDVTHITKEYVRRIPASKTSVNKTNTNLYRFIPGYGYRRVNLTQKPIIDWNN